MGIVRLQLWRGGAPVWIQFGSSALASQSGATHLVHATALPSSPVPGLFGFTLNPQPDSQAGATQPDFFSFTLQAATRRPRTHHPAYLSLVYGTHTHTHTGG